MTLPNRFFAKTRPADCLVWTGALNSRGYPCFSVNGASHLAHRLAYEEAYGPIPEGMTVDHLCGYCRCVNPAHLEAVSAAENTARAARKYETCQEGHPLDRTSARGKRYCSTCARDQSREHYARDSVGSAGASSSEVRAWALAQGLTENARGNLPKRIRDAYAEAHLTPHPST